MLDKIVEFFLKGIGEAVRLHNTPKARSGRALLDIYNAMVDCQEAYLKWKKNSSKKRGVKKYEGKDYEEWGRRVRELDAALMRAERKLQIMAPDVHGHLDRYFKSEVIASKIQPGDRSVITKFIPTMSLAKFGSSFRSSYALPELKDVALGFEYFEVSVEPLRRFIRENYTWDELFS